PVTLTALTDHVYGNLNGSDGCAVSQTIASCADYTCTFTGSFTGIAGASQTDTVTATAKDDDNTSTSANASATVTLDDAAPTISVTKTAVPTHHAKPGGTFCFTVIFPTRPVTDLPVTLTAL